MPRSTFTRLSPCRLRPISTCAAADFTSLTNTLLDVLRCPFSSTHVDHAAYRSSVGIDPAESFTVSCRRNALIGDARSPIICTNACDDSGTVKVPLVVSRSRPSSAQFNIPGNSALMRRSRVRSSRPRNDLFIVITIMRLARAPDASPSRGNSFDMIARRADMRPVHGSRYFRSIVRVSSPLIDRRRSTTV